MKYDMDTLAQLVEDVEQGNESALKAFDILISQKSFIEKCLKQIDPIVQSEKDSIIMKAI